MAGTESGGVKKKRAIRFACCTPAKHCNGSLTGDGLKNHSSSIEVHKCQGKYLVSQGYKKLSKREYKAPDILNEDGNVIEVGPVLVLNKKAARSKGGKADRYMRGNQMDQKIRSW